MMKESSDTFNRRRRRTPPGGDSQKEDHQFSANEGSGNHENDKGQRHSSIQRVLNSLASLQRKLSRQMKPSIHRFWFWCLETKNKATDRLSGLSPTQIRLLLLAKFILFLLKLLFLHWLFSKSLLAKHFLGRSETDEQLNEIPVIIPIFDFPKERDIGGWKWRHTRRFYIPSILSNEAKENQTMPEFGGLRIDPSKETQQHQHQQPLLMQPDSAIKSAAPFVGMDNNKNNRFAPQRRIQPDDDIWAEVDWRMEAERFHQHLPQRDLWPEDTHDEKLECRFPNWVKQYRPLCNEMHQIAMHEPRGKHIVAHGSFRDVWLLDHYYPIANGSNPNQLFQTALKKLQWHHDHGKNSEIMGILYDATVMERLTMSPHIVDIYGHCGVSVWVEPMPTNVEDTILHKSGRMKQKDLHDEEELKPQNSYTAEEKLDLALEMAEGLADLHGFRDGVFVHDDLHFGQFLKNPDGKLKLGDFNRAYAMPYNTRREEYCKYSHGHRDFRERAPEEYVAFTFNDDDDRRGILNEKIDVYSYGNGIYSLLTGLYVFYDMVNDDEIPRSLVMNGTRAFVDPRWRTRSFIESELVKVMEECWTHNADQRISIFEVVRRLRAVRNEYEEHHKKKNNIESPEAVG